MSFNRYLYTDCKNCALCGKNKVDSEGPMRPEIVVIGEAPGKDEDETGKPFVGKSGYELNMGLASIGLARSDVYVMNVIACRPPRNEIESVEGQDAVNKCMPGFLKELEYLKSLGVKVFVPLGNTALYALGIIDKITVARGNIYYLEKKVIIPTYHPAYVMRNVDDKWQVKKLTWLNDLNKVKEYSKRDYKPPKEVFNINPTLQDVKAFVNRVVSGKNLVAVDIETTKLEPWTGRIVVVGLAVNEEEAISIPFLSKGDVEYWGAEDRKEVEGLLQEVLLKCPLMFQNALYDCYWLMVKGFEIGEIKHDTMLLHHCIHPELKHKLEFIASIYGKGPPWKNLFADYKIPILTKENEMVRTYNLRDVTILHQVLPGMLDDAREVLNVYLNISLPLIKPLLEMQVNGVLVDKKFIKEWKTEMEDELSSLDVRMRELCKLPDAFNIQSNEHQALLLYNKIPPGFAKVTAKMATYDEVGTKKNKNTKGYRELLSKARVVTGTHPLIYPKGLTVKKTTTGKYSVDEEAVNRFKIAALKRLEVIEHLKRYMPQHIDEEEKLHTAVQYVDMLARYNKVAKLLKTYADLPVQVDGKIHGKYLIHGTSTGRLSSRDPNMQNLPSVAKRMFVAPEGYTFIEPDFKNLELRILAYVSNDEVLQEMFRNELDVHGENAKKLFNCAEDDPSFKMYRRIAKTYIFGRNYGGGLPTLYKNMMNKVEDLKLTPKELERIDAKYFYEHPKYGAWRDKLTTELYEKKELVNTFGRKRIFLSATHEMIKEGLNFPIQSAAADITNKGIIKLFESSKGLFDLLMTVHDSVVVQTKIENVKEVVSILKACLEQEHIVNGMRVSFPVEISTGTNYGDLHEYTET